MQDTFYPRLDFYRLLHGGMTNLAEMAKIIGVTTKTLRRWKKLYDPARGPFGGVRGGQTLQPDLLPESERTDRNICPPQKNSDDRDEILEAMRRQALEGSVPAAKLLLTEIQDKSADYEEELTVEKAIELIRQWDAEKQATQR